MAILPIKGMAQLNKEEAVREGDSQDPLFLSDLTAHLKDKWQIHKEAKRPIEDVMIRSMRARNGIYESDKLAAIREMGGSEIYVLLTLTKCRACEAWVNDVLRPAGDRPWDITPTPLPELVPSQVAQIKQRLELQKQAVMADLQMTGLINDPAIQDKLQDYVDDMYDEILSAEQRDADERASRMAAKIYDQQIEGGWYSAFKQVLNDAITLKAGILKGPVIRKKKVKKWVEGAGGNWEQQLTDDFVMEFDRVSPFDFYPAAGATCVDDGDVFERHFLQRQDLVSLLGVPGYSDKNIRAALKDYAKGLSKETLPHDTERYLIEHGETATKDRTGKIEALEFWGSVPGKALKDWGVKDIEDDELEYEVNAWVVGDYVIKAILNPDKLGRKPYSVTNYEKIPGTIWGKGIPELMADIQDVCNALARALVNNSALASGPLTEINTEKCDNIGKLHPWKIFQSTNQQMNEAPAIRFYQPQIIVEQLLRVYEFFSTSADESTGVPRWAQGNTQIGGAGSTSSGLSMLMTYAARGIKQFIMQLDDDVIEPTIQRQYDYNMFYDKDPSIKGDLRIRAKGASSLIAREQQALRLKEILAATNNPIDYQLLGPEARFDLLKQTFKAMELNLEALPENKELKDMIAQTKAQMQQQNMQMPGQGNNAQSGPWKGQVPDAMNPQQDVAGNTMGGADTNLTGSAGA